MNRERRTRNLLPPTGHSRTQVPLSRKDYYRRCYEVPTSIPLAEPKLNLLCFMQYVIGHQRGFRNHWKSILLLLECIVLLKARLQGCSRPNFEEARERNVDKSPATGAHHQR
ncbi:hypothetical protein F2P81_003233 [Scophthalmus maximus]|uniref:Uncharacterized protein n=1 Tax=Scophthalmus maximus TaxID=52904 RepID=A0A6A4TFV6_SCOMX|nr:hypothetical protein F2P81_003233 [Scophthalmus maximus]